MNLRISQKGWEKGSGWSRLIVFWHVKRFVPVSQNKIHFSIVGTHAQSHGLVPLFYTKLHCPSYIFIGP
jgi:hypothetical protein